MGFLNRIFNKKVDPQHEKTITTYADFWNWFQEHEKSFLQVIKTKGNIEKYFFDVIHPKLRQLNDDIYYLVGIDKDGLVDLILTVDGNVRSIAIVEELVQVAPIISGWKFTALKPPMGSGTGIQINEFDFNSSTLHFYANDNQDYPDEIDITVVHDDYKDDRLRDIIQGVYLYLDNYLGELLCISAIDNVSVAGRDSATKELIPIDKLEDYIVWREKEFVEKYEGNRRNTEQDNYSLLQAKLKNGKPLIAVINTDALKWERKASHPWIMTVVLGYNANSEDMPDETTLAVMEDIESKIQSELTDADGYIYIGRQTADGIRELYYVCNEFRKPSKLLHSIVKQYTGKADISFDIYKNKYWRTFERFAM